MSESLMTLLIAVVSGGIGVFTARLFSKNSNQKTEAEAQERAAEILKNAELEAENIKKNRILEAKEKYLQLKSEFDETSNQKKQIIIQNEQKIKQREQQINQMMEQNKRRESELETQKNTLSQQTEIANKRREEAEKFHKQQIEQLERIANLTAEQAREQMMEAIKADAQAQASAHIKNTIDEAKLTATKEAKKIVIETIQRTAAEHAIENCVSVFNIESDDIKGKAGYFTANRVKTRNNDGFWGIIHNDFTTSGGFEGTDIAAFSSNHLSFNII